MPDKPVPRKINEKGKYCLFPGITVVSACFPEHKDFCYEVYNALSESDLLVQYFSLLPAESYHMTTMDLHTQERVGDKWRSFVEKNLPRFREIKQTLQKADITPVIEDMRIDASKGIILQLTVSAEQRELIKQTAEKLDIEEAIPPFFHITLAYPIPQKLISKELRSQLQEEVLVRLSKIIESYPAMVIAQAKLCYFHDMNAFIPWDAQESPFNKKIASPSQHNLPKYSLFLKKADVSEVEEENPQAKL